MIRMGTGEPVIKTHGIHLTSDISTFPSVAVGVFSRLLFEDIVSKYQCSKVGYMKNANFTKDVYIIKYKEVELTFFMASVGAPHIAADIEELSFNGVKKFIIFGNCGVLDKTIPDCGIIIPTRAYKEDGVSYHYSCESDYIDMSDKFKEVFKDILKKYDFDYREGATWTTDAFYRETRDKVDYYKNKGCLCVEMEASAITAVCEYKKLDYFTFYYAGDNLDSIEWEERSLHGEDMLDKKKEVALLALELARIIS